jgi:uncharacterized membrane protein
VAKSRKIILIGAIFTALVISAVSWAVSSSAFLNINVSTDTPQLVNSTRQLNGSFTLNQGRAQKIEGIELFEVNLGSPRFSDQIRINLLLTNPDAMRSVLNNPNSYIEVAVWYEDSNGTHTLSGTTTKVKKDESASAIIHDMNANVLLLPSIPNQEKLYILASIMVPGGSPPGQQPPEGSQLDFFIDVRM